jgi:hypothetical protein
VAKRITSGLTTRFLILSASGRLLSLKCTIPCLSITSGQGARSIFRPLVSAIGTCKMLERMSLIRECSRYGALIYGIALFDLLKNIIPLVSKSRDCLSDERTYFSKHGISHPKSLQPIDPSRTWYQTPSTRCT